ncbi:hypothetical protein GQ457_14G007440 [Hibiscus cannabinus]
MKVEEEVERLKQEIQRFGHIQPDGFYKFDGDYYTVINIVLARHAKRWIIWVTFGVLFHDDRCANIFEALVGTLRAAKKRKLVAYDGELLLQGVHDNVEITLKATTPPQSSN